MARMETPPLSDFAVRGERIPVRTPFVLMDGELRVSLMVDDRNPRRLIMLFKEKQTGRQYDYGWYPDNPMGTGTVSNFHNDARFTAVGFSYQKTTFAWENSDGGFVYFDAEKNKLIWRNKQDKVYELVDIRGGADGQSI